MPPEPSCGFRPILSLALPLARGATPVSRDTVRKSESVRPSARCGGSESMPVWMYDLSAFEIEMEVMIKLFESNKHNNNYLNYCDSMKP